MDALKCLIFNQEIHKLKLKLRKIDRLKKLMKRNSRNISKENVELINNEITLREELKVLQRQQEIHNHVCFVYISTCK